MRKTTKQTGAGEVPPAPRSSPENIQQILYDICKDLMRLCQKGEPLCVTIDGSLTGRIEFRVQSTADAEKLPPVTGCELHVEIERGGMVATLRLAPTAAPTA